MLDIFAAHELPIVKDTVNMPFLFLAVMPKQRLSDRVGKLEPQRALQRLDLLRCSPGRQGVIVRWEVLFQFRLDEAPYFIDSFY